MKKLDRWCAAGLGLVSAFALTAFLSGDPLPAAAARTVDGHSFNINGYLAPVLVVGTTLTFGF